MCGVRDERRRVTARTSCAALQVCVLSFICSNGAQLFKLHGAGATFKCELDKGRWDELTALLEPKMEARKPRPGMYKPARGPREAAASSGTLVRTQSLSSTCSAVSAVNYMQQQQRRQDAVRGVDLKVALLDHHEREDNQAPED